MQGKEVIPHAMPVFTPCSILKALFFNYTDIANRIFQLHKTDAFWKSIKDDDPKLLALMKDLPWAT